MRKLLLFVLLAVLMTVVGSAAAQENCGNLSADDCALLQSASEATANASSADFDFTLTITVGDLMPEQELEFVLSGNGAYAVDAEALAGLTGGASGQEALNALTGAIQGFNGELYTTLTVPDMLAPALGLPSNEINLNLALVDGVGYVDFDALDALTGGSLSQSGMTGWGGLNFVDLINQLVASDPTALDQLNLGDLTAATSETDMEALNSLVTVERAADEEGLAVFVSTLDIAALAELPGFREGFEAGLSASNPGMSEADVAATFAALENTVVTITQYVDPSSGYVVSGTLELTINLGETMRSQGTEIEGDVPVTIYGEINYSNFDAATVEAPEGAQIAPPEMLFGLLGAGMSGQ